MKILSLITARGGSKRLPGKNTRPLDGKPLVLWSIDVVKNIPQICNILVSTDDTKTAEICRGAGASVPWLRPAELASDEASSVDVAIHALDWYEDNREKVDGLLLMQPTSPFRTEASVREGIRIFTENAGKYPVLGVSRTSSHPMWMLKIENDFMKPLMAESGFGLRSQDLPPVYSVNGSFYLISPAQLRENKSFISELTLPLLINSDFEAIDIDTEHDWAIAESLLKSDNR